MKKTSISILIVAFMLLSLLSVESVKAEDTPYYGKTYSQSEQVLKLYKEPDIDFDTPAFTKKGDPFTTQEEMIAFLSGLQKKSKHLKIENIGKSIDGRDIPALLFFKKERHSQQKPTIWLQGQIHGNEPAGGESVLVMAQKMAGPFGEKILKDVNVIIVPRVNPDGSYKFDRRTSSNLDANRDHVKLDLPELKSIHQLFNKYMPEVTIDAHEYGVGEKVLQGFGEEGSLKYHDLTVLSGKNLNIPANIRNLSDDLYIKNVNQRLKKNGYSSRNYYTDSMENGELHIKEGGTDPRIGRNAFGLTPSLSFLVESRGIGIGRENFKRRVASQVETHTEIFETTAKNAKMIKKLIQKERMNVIKKGILSNDNDEIVIQDKQVEIPNETLEVVDIKNGDIRKVPIRYFSATDAVATLKRKRPTAYVINSDEKETIEKLKLRGVKVFQLPRNLTLPVEAYTVSDKTDGGKLDDRELSNVGTKISTKNVHFKKGSYVVTMAQPTANVAATALEPESKDSYVSYQIIESEVGRELPIYRFTKGINKHTFK